MPVTHWRRWHTIALLVLVALFVLAALFSSVVLSWFGLDSTSVKALWIGFMVLMLITIVLIGQGITGLMKGFLIDSRNKMSLSRLQLILWTILVLPAFLAAAVFNFVAGDGDPLNIAVPPEVWGLLGISAGALVGSGIIKSGRDEADRETVEVMAAEAPGAPDPVAAEARIRNLEVVNTDPNQANVSDLFRGNWWVQRTTSRWERCKCSFLPCSWFSPTAEP